MLPTRKSIKTTPQTTGVYMFMSGRTPIYIGKAVNLRARLLSHLENAKSDAKEAAIFAATTSIKTIPIASEFQALVREAELIRHHLPHYNKIWKDDKSYLYLTIDMREEFPKIRPVRKHDLESAQHKAQSVKREAISNKTFPESKTLRVFGPFPSARVIEKVLKEIRRVIPFCSQKNITTRPCFHSKIGLCNPCPNAVARLNDSANRKRETALYRGHIRAIIKIFEGKAGKLTQDLYAQIRKLSEEEKFEEALELRNRIRIFERFISENAGIEQEGIETFGGQNPAESLHALLRTTLPGLAPLARVECYDISNTSQREGTAALVVATEGAIDKSQYRKFRIKDTHLHSDFEMLEEVMRRRFKHETRDKQQETRTEKQAADDLSSVSSKPMSPVSPKLLLPTHWPLPDLVVVDGGRPQVRVLEKVFAEQGVLIPVIGIAKNPDRLIVSVKHQVPSSAAKNYPLTPDTEHLIHEFTTLRPPLNHIGFNLVRRLRDEAHRFSRKYHRLLRARAGGASPK